MRRRTGSARRRVAVALALLALAAAPALARAQGVKLRAEVDRPEVAADELVTLTLRVEAAEAPESVAFPEGELPFEVVSRAESRASSFSTGGGGGVSFRKVTTYRLALRPRGPGPMVIPSIIARVRGNVYTSSPIKVTVLPAGARPGARGLPRTGTYRGWERDLVLRVELDRTEVFLGEQVTAEVWLLSPLGVTAYEGFKPPLHDGFWAEELEAPRTLEFKLRTVDGVPTRAYLVQRLALFPTRSGALSVGAFQLDVAVRSATDSPFDLLPQVRRARRTSAPIPLKVKPLPPGAPPGFESVNVGRLVLEARVLEPEVVAGEPFTVQVTATGQANLRALSLPRLPAIAGTRSFEPTTREKLAPRGDRLGGSRAVETVLVPERTGELVIPALSWPVFDPRAGRYEQLQTAELRLGVRPGQAGGPVSAGVNTLASGLRPIRTDGALESAGPPPWRGLAFLGLVVAPPLGFAALALALRARDRTRAGAGARRTRGAGPAARSQLRTARRRLADGEQGPFLAEVDRALLGYATDRLGRPAAGLTREALAAALAEAGAHPPAVKLLTVALEACDRARYGLGAVRGEELLAAAEHALDALDEADWSPARQEGRA